MKLGLKRGSHWYSVLVRIALVSEWSHACLEINGVVYESVALKNGQPRAGVRSYPITDAFAAEYEWIGLGNEGECDALAQFHQVDGASYDFFSLLAFLPFIRARDSRAYYCYEVVALMLGMEVNSRMTPEKILYFVLTKGHK